MDGLHFIYFADPMCSWCYGFSPVMRQLRGRYGDVLPMCAWSWAACAPARPSRCRRRPAAASCITGRRSAR